jgi:hypothetical protein
MPGLADATEPRETDFQVEFQKRSIYSWEEQWISPELLLKSLILVDVEDTGNKCSGGTV